KEVRALEGWPDGAWALAFAPDGKSLAGSGLSTGTRLWDVSSGKVLRKFEGPEDKVFGLSFRPDGKNLAGAVWDPAGHVFVWDPATGAVRRRLEHGRMVRRVAFAPDSSLLAATGMDGTVTLWETGTGKVSRVLPGTELHVFVLAFSPEG